MDERIKQELNRKNPTEFHKKMLDHCKGLMSLSYSEMSRYYCQWDSADRVYRGERYKDEEDKRACKQGAPEKMVLPLTYAQVQTFIAFAMNLLNQREMFFELEGTGEEDHRAAKLAEALLDQNLTFNQWTALLYQFLLDMGRFSIGVIKHSWCVKTQRVWKEEEIPLSPIQATRNVLGQAFGAPPIEPKTQQVPVDQTVYKGNELRAVSPYNFFPDPRIPLNRFQEGEFCGSEDEVSHTTLKRLQSQGFYSGVDHIQELKGIDFQRRRGGRFRQQLQTEGRSEANNLKSTVLLTEVQLDLIPKEFMLADGQPMGDSDIPEKWVVVYANDTKIIRCEPMNYDHGKFTYTVGQFSPDQQNFLTESITEVIAHMQAVIDWFINSHITNVRKHISNRLVIDPSGIFYEDVRDHKAVIRLKPNAAAAGVDRYVKQLNVSDVTRGHIQDVEVLMKYISMTTAINDNIMGQFHTGRRSAREAGNVAAASGTRLRNIIKIIYDTAFRDMGLCMISNLRDGLDEDMFVSIMGTTFPDWDAYDGFKVPESSIFKVPVNRTDISGRYDFKLFEGTLPSEKAMQAETLEQTLLAMMRVPDGLTILTQMLGYDPKKLFTEVLILRGIKHPDRFKITEFRLMEIQQAQAEAALLQNPPQPTNGPTDPTAVPPTGGNPAVPQGQPAQQPVPTGQPSFSALVP